MSFTGTQQKCKACSKTVYPMELVSADGIDFHKSCFKCTHCKGTLKVNKQPISAWFYSISLLIIADRDFVFGLCVFFSKLFWYGGSVVGRLCTLSSWSFCGMHIRMWNLHVTAVDLTIINYEHKLDGNTGWLCMSDVICNFGVRYEFWAALNVKAMENSWSRLLPWIPDQ